MAVNEFSRWSLLRDITVGRQSGTLVLQLGQQYISWAFHEGSLGWITSTHPDYTMTQFLLQNEVLPRDVLDRARADVNASRSLGAALLKEGVADSAMLQDWATRHAAWLCPLLLQTSTHIYWADRLLPVKSHFIHLPGTPLCEILLSCERASVEVRSAFQFARDIPHNYRAQDPDSLYPVLSGIERRLIPYLRRGEGLATMFADPELDRLTCCRTLLILWIAGRLHPVSFRSAPEQQEAASWLDRARSIPPDWIIPLVLGILLGVLFSPSPDKPDVAAQTTQPLHEVLKAPAWRPPPEENDTR